MSSRRPRPDEQPYHLQELTPTRKAIGDRTRQSKQTKPDFWMSAQMDATALVEARAALKAAGVSPLPSFNDFILKAIADVLRDNPSFNAWVAEDGLHLLDNVNICFATATPTGVMMPVVLDADKKTLAQIAEETRGLIDMARNGKLRASLQMGAGFSISNIGPSAVDAFSAIINPPQTGIIAIGSLKDRPVVADGQVVARKTVIMTLSIDHAAADGADGAKLLGDVKAKLEGAAYLAGLSG
jgi:pyruvate dehydrogenase E2 component (dihydrolipoamide acetyltransferase)